jgi:hypothetical protein
MKRVFVIFLALASTAATLAVAQDGNGNGPPDAARVVVKLPLPSRIPGSTSTPKLSQTHTQLR